jgi:AcrR family transcriptional regulator
MAANATHTATSTKGAATHADDLTSAPPLSGSESLASPRRGRKLSEERGEEILDAVLDLLHEVGYDQLRMQDVADRAGVGLSTIYRRWPTKQDVIRASLECERAQNKFVCTGHPRADAHATLKQMAENITGDGAQQMLGFLATMRSDPEVADVLRQTAIAHLHQHLRALIVAEIGEVDDLDLRATIGPATIVYQAAICGQPMDAEAMATQLTTLMFAPPTG